MTDLISRADAIAAVCDGCVWYKTASCEVGKEEWECSEVNKIRHLPSADAVEVDRTSEWVAVRREEYEDLIADAVTIHNDGTLEVKVPNATKVGRVLVMDTDSHIGGGLFYPADAVQGEWLEIEDYNGDYHYQCSVCKDEFYLEYGTPKENGYAYCPSCGAKMKGGAE